MLPKKRKLIKLICIVISIFLIIASIINCVKKNKNVTLEQLQKIIRQEKLISTSENTKGTTYYISSSGTSSIGTDINDPMSLDMANTKTFYGGDRVLFRKGDIFFGKINFNVKADEDNMFYIGSYGNQNLEKPIITTSYYITNVKAWQKKDHDIYMIDLSDRNNFYGFYTYYALLYDIGFFRDENNNIYGNKRKSIDELKNEFDFYSEGKYLYIKASNNPSELLGKITLANNNTIVSLNSNTILDGIIIKDSGAHGIVKSDSGKNIAIINCVIQNIGGSILQDVYGNVSRYGNGIEFWNQAENTIVQNCIFKNIYDAAYTLQGSSVTEGFNNNICSNNIFINCSYPIEMSCHNGNSIENCYFENNIVKNNIIINQGQGYGYETRSDKYKPSNMVIWMLPYPEFKLEYTENRIYNCKSLYYKGNYATSDLYESDVHSDKNFYYISVNTYTFIDTQQHTDLDYLYSQGLDLNSTFNYLSDSEIEEISNEEILNSDNYDEIKAYYDNFDIKYRNNHWGQDTISSIDEIMNEEEYNNLLDNSTINASYIELKNAISKLSENVDTVSQDSVSYSYECLYNFISTIVNEYNNNNISIEENILLELIEKLDNISEKYKEIYSYYITEDSIGLDTVKNDLNNTIDKYNNNLDLDIGSLENIIIKIKDLYNNSITTDNVYENVLNKNRIIYITNIVNSIIDSKINNFVAEEKGKIQVEFDRDINEPTNENITVTLITGDSTKITNNEGSNKYTFYENGKFIFELDIKGVKVSVEVTIANINKDYTIEDGYISNISNNTLAYTLKEELNLNSYTVLHNGKELDLNKDVISTGDILKYDNKEYTLIVSGDVDKDGDCGTRDLVSLRKYLLDYTKYDIIEEMAADTNQDDSLDIKDLVGMRKIILN